MRQISGGVRERAADEDAACHQEKPAGGGVLVSDGDEAVVAGGAAATTNGSRREIPFNGSAKGKRRKRRSFVHRQRSRTEEQRR